MKSNFPPLKMALPTVETKSSETFDCSIDRLTTPRINGQVNDTVRARTYYRDQLDITVIDEAR